jgi:hypothetical protein
VYHSNRQRAQAGEALKEKQTKSHDQYATSHTPKQKTHSRSLVYHTNCQRTQQAQHTRTRFSLVPFQSLVGVSLQPFSFVPFLSYSRSLVYHTNRQRAQAGEALKEKQTKALAALTTRTPSNAADEEASRFNH